MSRTLGYTSYFSDNASLHEQIAQLKDFGCEKVWFDTPFYEQKSLPNRHQVLTIIRPADHLILVSLARLGFSKIDVIKAVNQLLAKKVIIHCIEERLVISARNLWSMIRVIRAVNKAELIWKLDFIHSNLQNLNDWELLLIGEKLFIEQQSRQAICRELGISLLSLQRHEHKIAQICFEVWGSNQHYRLITYKEYKKFLSTQTEHK